MQRLGKQQVNDAWTPSSGPFVACRTLEQFCGLRYIDDPILRRPDPEAVGGYWHVTDVQFSTMALLDNNAAVYERVWYTPYGEARHHWGQDYNGDRDFDIDDANALLTKISGGDVPISSGDYVVEMDYNRDGVIDFEDYPSGSGQTAVALGQISDLDATSGPDNWFGYAGYVWEGASSLYHVRFRSYSPKLGRWMQRDPLGYVDGMSLYEFLHNSPLNYGDPSGLDDFIWEDVPGVKDGVRGTYHHRYRTYRCGFLWLAVCTEYVDSRFTRDGSDVDDKGQGEYQRSVCAGLDSAASKARKGLEVAQAGILAVVVINIPGPEDIVIGAGLGFLRGGGKLILNKKTGEWTHKFLRGDGTEASRVLTARQSAALEEARLDGLLKTDDEIAEELAEKSCKPKKEPCYSDTGTEHTKGTEPSV